MGDRYYPQYGYHNSHYPQQYSGQSQRQRERSYQGSPRNNEITNVRGLIIGMSYDRNGKHFLLYSKKFDDFIHVDNPGLMIGNWLNLTVFCQNYRGDFTLNTRNSSGYDYLDVLPRSEAANARFFPQRNDDEYIGELLVAARFGVSRNEETRSYEYISYEINADHLVDHYDLIKTSDRFYAGRSFIVEAQASLDGFVVVKVHEDPDMRLSCDSLPDSVVSYDFPMLDDTCLLTIMTGNGYAPQPQPPANSHQSVPSSRQNRASRSPSRVSQRNISDVFVSSSTNSLADLRSSSETELQNIASDSNDNTITAACPTLTEQNKVLSLKSISESSSEEDEETMNTIGTRLFLPRKYLKDVAEETLQRCYMEKALVTTTTSALCVVVQKMDDIAILYTLKRDVQNVLLLENTCQGLDDSLKLGDVGFFEISPRRKETKDEILPSACYSHIAVRRKPLTSDLEKKIALFKKSVRTFGGLLEMRVKINLREIDNVAQYYDDDLTLTKSETERKFYILTATNGVQVTIPTARLIDHLSSKFTANFELEAWAVHRKQVGSISLHIGPGGEATQLFSDGTARLLPPLSDTLYMNVRK